MATGIAMWRLRDLSGKVKVVARATTIRVIIVMEGCSICLALHTEDRLYALKLSRSLMKISGRWWLLILCPLFGVMKATSMLFSESGTSWSASLTFWRMNRYVLMVVRKRPSSSLWGIWTSWSTLTRAHRLTRQNQTKSYFFTKSKTHLSLISSKLRKMQTELSLSVTVRWLKQVRKEMMKTYRATMKLPWSLDKSKWFNKFACLRFQRFQECMLSITPTWFNEWSIYAKIKC